MAVSARSLKMRNAGTPCRLASASRQVRRAGIRRVDGNVLIDDRLFHASFNPQPTPVMVNDNLIDVVTKPAATGRPANVSYRPKSATLAVDAHVRTVAAGKSAARSPDRRTTSIRISLIPARSAGGTSRILAHPASSRSR